MMGVQMDTIGDRIRSSRLVAKLTQNDVAQFVGVSRVSVTQWENGASAPAKDKIQALAQMLSVPLEWLLYGDNNEANAAPDEKDGTIQTIRGQPARSEMRDLGNGKAWLTINRSVPFDVALKVMQLLGSRS